VTNVLFVVGAFDFQKANDLRAKDIRSPESSPATTPASGGADAAPKLVFGKVIAITPAANSDTDATPNEANDTSNSSPKRTSIRLTVSMISQVASFVILLLLSVQWQRTHASVSPMKSNIEALQKSLETVAQRQVVLEDKLDRLMSMLAEVQPSARLPHASSAYKIVDTQGNGQDSRNVV
jgi:hypothetical protein